MEALAWTLKVHLFVSVQQALQEISVTFKLISASAALVVQTVIAGHLKAHLTVHATQVSLVPSAR